MKNYHCQQCNQPVYFHNQLCTNCSSILGYDPVSMEMLSLRVDEPANDDNQGLLFDYFSRTFKQCQNGVDYDVCNWLIPGDSQHTLCQGCQFNRIIPNLANPANIRRWHNFENAKKRLLCTLFKLGLPIVSGHSNPDKGLIFDLIEDHRTNLDDYSGTFVHTGYLNGVITINALEADDVERAVVKQQMNETYRTLIGHLRHESGHFIWPFIENNESLMAEFKTLFGDVSDNYTQTLENYYQNGPVLDWQKNYISAYASSHPAEDWAEVWGHYLFIYDATETAAAYGIIPSSNKKLGINARVLQWQKLSVVLNELNRSAGLDDAYPFVLNEIIGRKLSFVEKTVAFLNVEQERVFS